MASDVIAGEVMGEAAALLNDPAQTMYTDALLLPLLQKAYAELELELHTNGHSFLREVSAGTTVTAGDIVLTGITDIVEPKIIEERDVGSTLRFVPMKRFDWLPDDEPTTFLRFWSWRAQQVHFIGSTADREVRLRYFADLPDLTDANSAIVIDNAKEYLSPRLAAIASTAMGENYEKARFHDVDATQQLHKIVVRSIHGRQATPARRRGFFKRLRRFY